MAEYAARTDESGRAVALSLNPMKLGRSPQHGAHMRAFWASTLSFFLAFVGWFALAPIAVDVAESIGICENQLYSPHEHPTRKAYLKYQKAEAPKEPYCTYGRENEGDPTDCLDSSDLAIRQRAGYSKYNFGLLPSCVCTPGTRCSNTILHSSVGSVAVGIFLRGALGTLLERFGPVNVQSCLMVFGAIWAFASAGIQSEWSFIFIRTMSGCVGASFVTTQFWCSLMFAPNIVGTANATVAGWGNLGGGVAQILVMSALFKPLQQLVSRDQAWRVAMVVPGALLLLAALLVKLTCWDTPRARRFTTEDTGRARVSLWDYVACLKDYRVAVMMFQYSACFGAEVTMNAQLATHFRTDFQLESGAAAALASSFGLMNLFARSLGGLASDLLFKSFGFPGRLWAQYFTLHFAALLLLCFGFVESDKDWLLALVVLIVFSLFVQMAEGTSYAIVPFMIPEQLACVSALVAAGGNLGAVVALWCFYTPLGPIETLLPYKVHAAYVFFSALLSGVYYWPDKGGLFLGPMEEFRQRDGSLARVVPC